MSELAVRAELLKLARILDTDLASVRFLDDRSPAELRVLRHGITEAMFEKFRGVFSGFARLSGLLPTALSAKISEHVLGPTLSGRIAGEMPPGKAIDLSARLGDTFLADTCLQLDPDRAQAIVAGFPTARAVAITQILLARREYITMGQFVDVLPETTLLAATDAIRDPADLLHISFFVENTDQLDRVIAYLDEPTREAVIAAAAAHDLWVEVIATLQRIGADSRRAMAALALRQDEATLDSLIRAAAAHDLWPELLGLGRELPRDATERLAAHPAFDEPDIVASVIDSVLANELWQAMHAQLPVMGSARTARLLQVAADRRPAFLQALAALIEPHDESADTLRAAAAELDDAVRERALAACGDRPLASLLA